MDCEAKMITNGKAKPEPNVVASFSDLAHDVVELGELQAQLLKLDLAAAWQRTRNGVILLVIGGCLLLGCIPILWLTIAEALVEFAEWSRTASLAVAGLIGLAIAGAIAGAAWMKLKKMLEKFNRSRDDFVRNVAWVKSTLKGQVASKGHGSSRATERRMEVPLPS
jgi:hypothetical protein